ncbi:MAG: phospho-N-acetylmuramoyl-pentapeptide-transferase [Lachnospiraceae bacterium]|jgi:phospho-N-acetylmuramoyl-pentapeptide-transferase
MDIFLFLSLGVSFIIGVIFCPVMIPLLHRMKFGQQIRQEGPKEHLKKSGTPTMGGIVIMISMLIGTALLSGNYPDVYFIMLFSLLFGLIGLIDDILKIVRRRSEGLKAWQKMGLQVIVCAAMLIYAGVFSSSKTTTIVPFIGRIDMGGWFYPLAAFAVLGTVNGANFTDGVDGLASNVTIIIAGFFAVAAIILKNDAAPAQFAMIGSLMAFLIFNTYPAKVFMGDTGSLGIGGFVAITALMTEMPVFLLLTAFIYLIEIVSVILQVGYFKATHGKRLFKMAPIHHHFELMGWSETRVVAVFTVITALLSVVAYIGLRVAVG